MATLVYVLHVAVFAYGALGWMIPMPGPAIHLVFLLAVRYHWHATGGCVLTEWEKHYLGIPPELDSHFTRDLLRRMGFRHIDDDGSGRMTFKEFSDMCGLAGAGRWSESKLLSIWKVLDEDESGYIEAREFGKFMRGAQASGLSGLPAAACWL